MSDLKQRLAAWIGSVFEAEWRGNDPPTVHIVVVGLVGSGRENLVQAFDLGEPETLKSGIESVHSAGGGINVSTWQINVQDPQCTDDDKVSTPSFKALKDASCIIAIFDAEDEESWPYLWKALDALQSASFAKHSPLLVVANSQLSKTARRRGKDIVEAMKPHLTWRCGDSRTFSASCNAESGDGVRDVLAMASAMSLMQRGSKASSKSDPYEEWLRDAAAKQEADQRKGPTAVSRASPKEYLLAIICLFFALFAHTVLRKYIADS